MNNFALLIGTFREILFTNNIKNRRTLPGKKKKINSWINRVVCREKTRLGGREVQVSCENKVSFPVRYLNKKHSNSCLQLDCIIQKSNLWTLVHCRTKYTHTHTHSYLRIIYCCYSNLVMQNTT